MSFLNKSRALQLYVFTDTIQFNTENVVDISDVPEHKKIYSKCLQSVIQIYCVCYTQKNY